MSLIQVNIEVLKIKGDNVTLTVTVKNLAPAPSITETYTLSTKGLHTGVSIDFPIEPFVSKQLSVYNV